MKLMDWAIAFGMIFGGSAIVFLLLLLVRVSFCFSFFMLSFPCVSTDGRQEPVPCLH